jgi:hypothetical protein
MRKVLRALALSGGIALLTVAPAAAAPQAGGIAGLVNVIVQVEDSLNNTLHDGINVDVSNSLNNLLQNALQYADINVLNNVLNNALQHADITVTIQDITVVGDSVVITVLGAGGVADTITLV